MTYNELEELYPDYTFKAPLDTWEVIKRCSGNCNIEYNIDDFDKEIYIDVI